MVMGEQYPLHPFSQIGERMGRRSILLLAHLILGPGIGIGEVRPILGPS